MDDPNENRLSIDATTAEPLKEPSPDASYDAMAGMEQWQDLGAYLAYDDGGLAEAPYALAAYLAHQQEIEM